MRRGNLLLGDRFPDHNGSRLAIDPKGPVAPASHRLQKFTSPVVECAWLTKLAIHQLACNAPRRVNKQRERNIPVSGTRIASVGKRRQLELAMSQDLATCRNAIKLMRTTRGHRRGIRCGQALRIGLRTAGDNTKTTSQRHRRYPPGQAHRAIFLKRGQVHFRTEGRVPSLHMTAALLAALRQASTAPAFLSTLSRRQQPAAVLSR